MLVAEESVHVCMEGRAINTGLNCVACSIIPFVIVHANFRLISIFSLFPRKALVYVTFSYTLHGKLFFCPTLWDIVTLLSVMVIFTGLHELASIW